MIEIIHQWKIPENKQPFIIFECNYCKTVVNSNEYRNLPVPQRVGGCGDIFNRFAFEKCPTCKSELKVKL